MKDWFLFLISMAIVVVIISLFSGCATLGNQRCQFVSGFTCINPY